MKKKTNKKMILSLFIIFTTCFALSTSAFADEMLSGARWKYMSMNSSNQPRCDLIVSTTYMYGNWAKYTSRAISNWNNYSNNKVSITTENFSDSNVDLMTYANYDWPYEKTLIAFTTVIDTLGVRYDGGRTTMGSSAEKFGDRIRYSSVIFNPCFETASGRDDIATNLSKVITHEIGHCINMGHPAVGHTTPSVMKQGWCDTMIWSNPDRPQVYDINALNSMYNKIYF